MIMVVGQAFLFTILPPIGREIGLEDYEVGLVMSVHGLFMLFTGPMWGALSESWGRRPVIVVGGVIFSISVIMFGMIVDSALNGEITRLVVIWTLVCSRAIFSLGAGAVTPASMALAADMSSERMRLKTMSVMAAATSCGAVVGPSVSAFLSGYGLSIPFYFIAFAGFFVVILSSTILPNVNDKPSDENNSYSALLNKPIIIIAVGSTFFMIGTYGTFSMLGFFIQDRFDLNPISAAQTMGLGLMCSASATIFVQVFLISWMNLKNKILIIIGVIFGITSILLMWFAQNSLVFYLAMVFSGLGQGHAMPAINTSLSLAAGKNLQGRVAGVVAFTQAVSFLIAPVTAVTLYQLLGWISFLMCCIMSILALVIFIVNPVIEQK